MGNLKFEIVVAELTLEDVVKVTVIVQINVHIKIKKIFWFSSQGCPFRQFRCDIRNLEIKFYNMWRLNKWLTALNI